MMNSRIFHDRCTWPAPHFNEESTLKWLSKCFVHTLPGTITNHYPSDFIGPIPPNGYLLNIEPAYLVSENKGQISMRLL